MSGQKLRDLRLNVQSEAALSELGAWSEDVWSSQACLSGFRLWLPALILEV